MDFNLTEEQLMIQQAARDFAQSELLPGVIERDEFSNSQQSRSKNGRAWFYGNDG
jgi:alkylation response protein AidB-like acyl-CoA dehydrogenase